MNICIKRLKKCDLEKKRILINGYIENKRFDKIKLRVKELVERVLEKFYVKKDNV